MNFDQELAKLGLRKTKLRLALLRLLATEQTSPSTVAELLAALTTKLGRINRVTLYRELIVLEKAGLISVLSFDDEAAKRYELSSADHRHHLVCLGCGAIDSVVLPHDLDAEERRIEQHKRFHIVRHALEFYGYCRSCQPR